MLPTEEIAHEVEFNIGHPQGIHSNPPPGTPPPAQPGPQGSSQQAGSPGPGPGSPGPGPPPASNNGGPPPPGQGSGNNGGPPGGNGNNGGPPPGGSNNNPGGGSSGGNNNNPGPGSGGGGASSPSSPPSESQGPDSTTFPPANVPTTAPSPNDATLDGDFDTRLDQQIGYFSPPFDRAFYNQVFPGMEISDQEIQDNNSPSRRDLARRGFFSKVVSVVKKAVTVAVAVVKAIPAVVQTVAAVVTSLCAQLLVIFPSNLDEEVVAVVLNTVAAVLPSFNLTPVNTDWSFTLPPAGFLPTEENVFGQGFKMFSYKKSGTYTIKGKEVEKEAGVTAYCIGCQISGKLHILGTLRYTFPTFITAATIQISGPMNLYAEVGLLLYTTLEKGFEKNILTIPISALAIDIPDIIKFGPEITLTMSASLKFEADGFLGVGLNATWSPGFSITLNFLNPLASTYANLAPSIVPVFQIGAAISITAEVKAEAGLELALNLFNGKVNLAAGVYYENGYTAQLIDGFMSGDDPQIGNGCNGLSVCLQQDKKAYLSAVQLSYSLYETSTIVKSWCETGVPTSQTTDDSIVPITTPTIPILTANPVPTFTTLCDSGASSYTASDQSIYRLECNSDRGGNDLTSSFSNPPTTFQACMDACSAWTFNNPFTPCLAVAWVPSRIPYGCYLKNPLPNSNPSPPGLAVDSAVVTRFAATCPDDNNGYYTSYTDGASYLIACDQDYPGNDIPPSPTLHVATLRLCIDMCSSYNLNNPGVALPCMGVSYVYADSGNSLACFLKNNMGGAHYQQSAYSVHSALLKPLPATRRRRGRLGAARGFNRRDTQYLTDADGMTTATYLTDADGMTTGTITDPPTTATDTTPSSTLYSLVVPTDDSKSPPGFSFDSSGLNDTQGQEDISAMNQAPYTNTTSDTPVNASDSNTTDSTAPANDYNGTVAQVWTIDRKAYLFNSMNGNLFLADIANSPGSSGGVDTSSMFQATDEPSGMYADYTGRVLYVYEDELNAYNVSRIRLANETTFPLTAIFVTIAPADTVTGDGGSPNLIAMSTVGGVYYLAACLFHANDAVAKLFVMRSMDGVATLANPGLQGTVTGGSVDHCVLVGLQIVADEDKSEEISPSASTGDPTATPTTTDDAPPAAAR
ncbi:hypothetical protein B0H17DRAFT_564985 [Mycena rosella]|uniref:DUF7223 domain-containing protein n=1 Tax=Mycena rosella TaxID=1033263 RepID=A0AAD7GIY1_MYCRO|nr:hypothetical protein B0H17DRAFT_564985 [Mycena rosella]